jgi:hypothetical protein
LFDWLIHEMTEKLKSLGLVELSSLNMNSSKPDIPMSLNTEILSVNSIQSHVFNFTSLHLKHNLVFLTISTKIILKLETKYIGLSTLLN